jgi:muramidase (flagellum-specific)
MSKQEFIEQIATYVKKYAPSYGIVVYSPIIAQAILESAYGTSELAVNACNFFGLKYREGRCKTCIGIYDKVGSEQNSDGSYTSSAMKWCKFEDMENGVIGYFDFTNISNYANLKGVTDPREYLENIKADGYAISLNYVDNLMAVIENWKLTEYDKKEENEMSNSSLVSYTKLSPNHSGQRTHSIDRITPHCVVGQLSAESICGCFTSTSRQASCNYGIGTDGKIALCVEEKNRSWCSSSNANDQRAVTIECASDLKEPYAMNSKVYASLVNLCVDICKRNGKSKLLWLGDKDKTLNYSPKSNEMVLTVHRWFANKSCPGNWLYARLGDLATEVTKKLGGSSDSSSTTTTTDTLYRVRKTWADSKSQLGAYKVLANAKKKADENPGYSVFDENGKVVYSGKSTTTTTTFTPYLVRVTADVLNIRKGAGTNYGTNGAIRDKGVYTIVAEASGQGATKWGKLKSGAGWISLDYTKKV